MFAQRIAERFTFTGNKLQMVMEIQKINRQPNRITMAQQNYSLLQKRILYLVINQMRLGGEQRNLFEETEYTFPIKLLGDRNYLRVREAAISLLKIPIVLVDNVTARELDAFAPIARVNVSKAGMLTIKFSQDGMRHFQEISEGYTSYGLDYAMSLESTFSQRMYEMLSSWRNKGAWRNVSLDALKKRLSLEGKYPKFSSFEQRVLLRAQEELYEKTDISFDYTVQTEGRKVVALQFMIKSKPTGLHLDAQQEAQAVAEVPMGTMMAYLIEAFKRYRFSIDEEKKILNDPALRARFVDVHTRISHGAVQIQREDGDPTPLARVHVFG